MATPSFYIRKNKDVATIIFRFSYKRGVSPFRKSTSEQIPSDAWDSKKQKVKDKISTFAYAGKINDRLDKILKHFEEGTKGEDISIPLLERLWLSIDDKKGITFLEFCDNHYQWCENNINPKTKNNYSEETLKKYKGAIKKLTSFSKDNYSPNFKSLNQEFHKRFIKYFEAQGLAPNSIGTILKNIKVFAKAAAKNHPVNNFILSDEFYLPSNETQSIYCDESEIQKIFDHIPKKKYLLNARNWFIIGCWTGLRVSDWNRVEDIKEDYITIKPKKTTNTSGKTVVIPVHWQIKSIIETYGMPSKISGQKFNDYIKEVFKEAGFNQLVYGSKMESIGKDEKENEIMRKKVGNFPKHELISSHTCRRSFATNNYLIGIDTLTIMQVTGHTTEKNFLNYIKVTPTQHAERLKEKWDKHYNK